jgi:hypothetical protein
MTMQFIRLVLTGMLIGAILFLIPFFILKAILVILVVRFLFRAIWWRGFRHGYHDHYYHESISGFYPETVSGKYTGSRNQGNNVEAREIKIK